MVLLILMALKAIPAMGLFCRVLEAEPVEPFVLQVLLVQ